MELKHITYRVSADELKELKKFAADEESSIQRLIEEGLELRKRKGSPKPASTPERLSEFTALAAAFDASGASGELRELVEEIMRKHVEPKRRRRAG